jgi:hypothetical protein
MSFFVRVSAPSCEASGDKFPSGEDSRHIQRNEHGDSSERLMYVVSNSNDIQVATAIVSHDWKYSTAMIEQFVVNALYQHQGIHRACCSKSFFSHFCHLGVESHLLARIEGSLRNCYTKNNTTSRHVDSPPCEYISIIFGAEWKDLQESVVKYGYHEHGGGLLEDASSSRYVIFRVQSIYMYMLHTFILS